MTDIVEIVDQQGNPITDYNPDHGYLIEKIETIHHDAVGSVEEQSHMEVTREYPNGGKDVERVIDVPGVDAQEAWEETVVMRVYIPYTAEEIAARDRDRRIAEIKQRLADTDYAVIKIAEGAATAEDYAPVIAQRQSWRAEINRLEAEGQEI